MCQMSYELDAQQCRSEYSIPGMMLKEHIFIVKKTANWLKCVDKCNHDVRCQSFNYVISQGICELNNRTKEATPEDFVPDSDRFYIKRLDERGIVLLSVFISIFLIGRAFVSYIRILVTKVYLFRGGLRSKTVIFRPDLSYYDRKTLK